MRSFFNPFDYFTLALQQQALMVASARTISRRTTLMMTGAMTAREATGMCLEKPTAFAKGLGQGGRAVKRGKSPAKVMSAALKPISAKASSNARRLSR